MIDLVSLVIGICAGLVVMGIICDKSNKAQVEEMKKEIERNNNNYYEAVSQLEGQVRALERELTTQRNVAKTLSDNNQRLLKSNKALKKCEHPNDETITYMVSLYGNWFDRSAEEHHLSPSEYIKKHWK